MDVDREKMADAIRAAAVGGRLTCEQAHEMSRRLSVPLREIGLLCNQLGIKIAACQLGCF